MAAILMLGDTVVAKWSGTGEPPAKLAFVPTDVTASGSAMAALGSTVTDSTPSVVSCCAWLSSTCLGTCGPWRLQATTAQVASIKPKRRREGVMETPVSCARTARGEGAF